MIWKYLAQIVTLESNPNNDHNNNNNNKKKHNSIHMAVLENGLFRSMSEI